jgi:hypothetical protein
MLAFVESLKSKLDVGLDTLNRVENEWKESIALGRLFLNNFPSSLSIWIHVHAQYTKELARDRKTIKLDITSINATDPTLWRREYNRMRDFSNYLMNFTRFLCFFSTLDSIERLIDWCSRCLSLKNTELKFHVKNSINNSQTAVKEDREQLNLWLNNRKKRCFGWRTINELLIINFEFTI